MAALGSTVTIGKQEYICIDEKGTLELASSVAKDTPVVNELEKIVTNTEKQLVVANLLPKGAATEQKQDSIIDVITTNLTLRLIESGVYTYVGEAIIGSDESDPVWKVKRIDETSGVIILWADGNENFDNVWSNYASLVYN